MKRVNIKCPYCGSQAFLRPASLVRQGKPTEPGEEVYVCAHYPACDSYVAAQMMSKKEAYRWMQVQMGLPETEAHIAKFSEMRCEQVIRLCDRFLSPQAA